MSDQNDKHTEKDVDIIAGQESDQLKMLRSILIGPEKDRIAHLQKRLDSPEIYTKELSKVVAEAIMLRSSNDNKIAQVLEPTIANTLKASVKKDPKALVDAISPIMGPSIRKAIVNTIGGMIQSLNQTLEYSFSLQGLKWRLEAIRTKKPFAEIVLLNTLIYQVEQVFLIHTHTGLVLQHVVAKEVETRDADLVSGMLTAIQDFVKDSFSSGKDESLDTLRVGDRNVLLNHGPYALVAAVIRGTPPPDYTVLLDDALDTIHVKMGGVLEAFDGDAAPFETVRQDLEYCLQAQFANEKKKISPTFWAVIGVVVFLLLSWSVFSLQNYYRWSGYVKKLSNAPGIIITENEKKSGRHYIAGLKDPLAPDPDALLKETGLKREDVVFSWKPYHSLHPEFVSLRIKNILNPPDTVTLELENGILSAFGSASGQWISEATLLMRLMPGVDGFDFNRLGETVPDENEQIRHMISSWSESARCNALEKRIEGTIIHFKEKESINIPADQKSVLHTLLFDFEKLFQLARLAGKQVYVEIVGHTDSIGTEKINLHISKKRAEAVREFLAARTLETGGSFPVLSQPHMCKSCHAQRVKTIQDNFKTVGVGAGQPLRKEVLEKDRETNRCVTFNVSITDIVSDKDQHE